jgi:hypothetical protein
MDRFIEKGGITSTEFEAFMNGKQFWNRKTRRKKHLRLVTTNAPVSLAVVQRRSPAA